ncbi:MAG: ribosome maturation factor RimM [Actinomycetota bacterium]
MVGEVRRAHGVRGELVVESHSENPERFAPGSQLLVGEGPDRSHPATVTAARPHRGSLLVTFEAVEDRGQAQRLAGLKIFARVQELPPLGQDTFWRHELVGLEVIDTGGRRLGRIAGVISRPDQDLWEVDTSRDPVLLPAVRDIVTRVDLGAGRVTVDPPVGLFPDPS